MRTAGALCHGVGSGWFLIPAHDSAKETLQRDSASNSAKDIRRWVEYDFGFRMSVIFVSGLFLRAAIAVFAYKRSYYVGGHGSHRISAGG